MELGERAILLKLVTTSKTLNNAPQYTVRVKDFRAAFEPAPDSFAFVPPSGAEKLSLDAVIELEELPQDALQRDFLCFRSKAQ